MTQTPWCQRQRHHSIFRESQAEKDALFFPLYKHSLVVNFHGCIHFKDRKGLLTLSSLASQIEIKQARILHMAQLLEVSPILALELNPVAEINHLFIFASCSKMGFPEFQLLL